MKSVLLKSSIIAAALAASISAYANDKVQELSPQQNAGLEVCNFTAMGMADIAAMRQLGKSKAEVVSEVESSATRLIADSQDKQLAGMVADYWKMSIEPIFQEPVYNTDEQKRAFVETAYAVSYQGCAQGVLQ